MKMTDKVRFSIMAGSRWNGHQTSFEVPKGTTIKTICDLLEVDSLERYDVWCAEGTGEYVQEGEIRSGSYRISYNKKDNFDKVYQAFQEVKK